MFHLSKIDAKREQTKRVAYDAQANGAEGFFNATIEASGIYKLMLEYANECLNPSRTICADKDIVKEQARESLKEQVERCRKNITNYTHAECAELFHAIRAADDVLRYSVKTIDFRAS